MAKFKKGDRVRYLGGMCSIPAGTICIIDENDSDCPDYHAEDGSHECGEPEDNFELIEDKPMKYAVGQILENDDRDYDREVVANFEDKALMTIDTDDGCTELTSVKSLECEGWHIKTTLENTEMTVKEIEDKLGVKNLKVVKE